MSATADDREANYVLTLDEIGTLAKEAGKPAETLMNVVALIANRFQADVCSAYLLEPDRANLVLAATIGLRPQCIGTLRMGIHEGLAGLVAEEVRPVAVEQVRNHPRFKYFREAGEDAYQSFLGVPLIDRGVLQGVLIVQTVDARIFREDEIRMLAEAAGQGALETAQSQSYFTLGRNTLGGHRASCPGTGAARPDQLLIPPPAGVSPGRSHLGCVICRSSAAEAGGLCLV